MTKHASHHECDLSQEVSFPWRNSISTTLREIAEQSIIELTWTNSSKIGGIIEMNRKFSCLATVIVTTFPSKWSPSYFNNNLRILWGGWGPFFS